MVAAAALSVVLLSSCSTSDSDPGSTDTTAASAPITPASAAAVTPPLCSPSGEGVPSGARTAPTIDVDGDLEIDQQWVTEDGGFGVTTTTGLSSSVHPTGLSGGAVLWRRQARPGARFRSWSLN